MNGFIKKREILLHPVLVCRICGWRGLVRCLLAHRGETFLSVAFSQ